MKKHPAKSSKQRTVSPPADVAGRVSHKIVRELQDAIAQAELKAGAFMPSERELAATFKVSRSSVREALSILETLGLLAIGSAVMLLRRRRQLAKRMRGALGSGKIMKVAKKVLRKRKSRLSLAAMAARLEELRVDISKPRYHLARS